LRVRLHRYRHVELIELGLDPHLRDLQPAGCLVGCEKKRLYGNRQYDHAQEHVHLLMSREVIMPYFSLEPQGIPHSLTITSSAMGVVVKGKELIQHSGALKASLREFRGGLAILHSVSSQRDFRPCEQDFGGVVEA